MRRILSSVLFFSLVASLVPPCSAGAAAKVPLDYKAYDSWNAIRGTKLSDDGNWIAYALVPQDGDSTLIVRNLTTGAEIKEERGLTPLFTPDSKFVVYTIRAKNDDIHKAEREHKTPAESPKNGLGILDLASGKAVTFERVKSVKLPHDPGSTTIAFLRESPPPSPKPSGAAAAPSAAPTSDLTPLPKPLFTPRRIEPLGTAMVPTPPAAISSPAAAPSPSASPDDLHKIEFGTDLAIRDLAKSTDVEVKNVSEYAIAHDGAFVAYATQAKDVKLDGVHVRVSESGVTSDLLSGEGHYKNLTFAPKHELFAFVSDSTSFAEKAPHFDLYQTDFGAATAPSARRLADPATAGMPKAWAPSVNGTLSYSKDGKRLFLGTAPVPTPAPSGTPEPMKVDIWSWRDGDLQPYQRINADKERKRTYTAVVHEDGGRFVQLASTTMRNVTVTENGDHALGENDVPYRKLISWEGESYSDVYAVSLHDGSRRMLLRKTPNQLELSPDGRNVVVYDQNKRSWFSIRTSDGKRTELTANLHVPFYDEQDDHPRPPAPYGFVGWVDDGRYALVLDRFDIWALDMTTGQARALTAGLGRKNHIRFTPLQLDPERTSYQLERPIVLRAFNDDTKDSGLYDVPLTGNGAYLPVKLFMLPKAVAGLQAARNSGRVVLTEQRVDETQNLWSAPSIGGTLTKISDANPQKDKYVWGRAKLVSYTSTSGKPLHGILLTPDNLDPKKKYPMLVYFYERYSDLLHSVAGTPAPGTSPNLLRYVSNGYVVLLPDVAYVNGHPGKSAIDCILPAIDSVVKRGFVDERRVGIAGHSWAAYQIVYMITQTNRFRAVEAGAAVANMTSAYGGIRWESGLVREFQYERDQSRIGFTPWDRLDLYIENSALFHIKNIHTPYLTIANDADGAVPWYQGIEFITAMRRLGKEAYMFEFDGEDHNLRGREQQKYWTVHLDEFFDHFLKGAPKPNWMTTGVDYVHRGLRDVRTLYGEKP
jgi:dipeptidyl aminopeptidase/acylaminoacyl peptidase